MCRVGITVTFDTPARRHTQDVLSRLKWRISPCIFAAEEDGQIVDSEQKFAKDLDHRHKYQIIFRLVHHSGAALACAGIGLKQTRLSNLGKCMQSYPFPAVTITC